MIKTNYHTHSLYCDGKSTLKQMVQSAIEHDIKILGFSGHCMSPFSSSWHIPVNQIPDYIAEVKALKEKYKDKITILLGFEADYVKNITAPTRQFYKKFDPDFLIGSVHFVTVNGQTFGVDDSAESLKENAEKFTNNDYKKITCEYFYTQREMLKKPDFQIIGHPDLIRKNNGPLKMFTEKEDWYLKEIKATAKAIAKAGVIAEINTGAIARKKMDDVYPSLQFLELLNQQGVPVTFSGDCHNHQDIDCAWERALQAALKAGYTELAYLDEQGNTRFQKIYL
ncbi:MAG: histidinol-phosphatase [Treponema sp.]|nr:histidinol-phosphatase [Treponema sp.]